MNILTNLIKVKNEVITHFPKSTEKIIEEIHETFYTEVDRLLAEAGIKHSLETEKQHILNKSNRLKNLGFFKSNVVIEAKEEEQRLDELKKENDGKVELIEAITYFSNKYPQYKFITEESVKKICNKYGLIYGNVADYKGNVPEKNLIDIECFNIEDIDECYFSRHFSRFDVFSEGRRRVSYGDKNLKGESDGFAYSTTDGEICPLEIVAPFKDFDLRDREIKDFKIQDIPDPIVLKPVVFNKKKHYLIITAWGLEADDELVKL